MKKINILLALAAISIGFNSYSQTIQDVHDRIQQISADLFHGEANFLEVELSDSTFPYTNTGIVTLDSEIIEISTYVDVRYGENHIGSLSYKFSYQAGELVHVRITKIDEIDGKPSPDITNKNFYFHKGKLFAETMGKGDIDNYTEKELEASDFSKEVDIMRLFDLSDTLLEKSREALNKNK